MLLSELLKNIEYTECINFKDVEINHVTENSLSVTNGSVFVCVRGRSVSGCQFSSDASERGAVAFVCEEKEQIATDKSIIICKNPRKCEAEISKALYGKDVENIKIIGITGTKGKTTTAKILAECTAHLGLKCVSIGTLGVEYYERGNKLWISGKSENTTPDSPFIYKALSDAYNDGAKVAILEVSSQALMNYRVYGIPFTVCIFTNFSSDHIGAFEHRSVEEYLNAKRTLFCDYGCKICIVNSDDESSAFISHGIEHIIKVGEHSESFRVKTVISDGRHTEFLLNGEEFFLSLGGVFNAYNAALALTAASLLFGRDISEFKPVLKTMSVRGRYELYKINEKSIIIDFAHNKESFKSVLRSVKQHTEKRIVLVFGSVGERSFARRQELAEVANDFADFIVITSDNPGFEDPEKICGEIYSCIKDKRKAKIITDREKAIRFAIDFADENDTVLLLGKGHEEYQEIKGEKLPFSEKEIIKSLGAKRV